MQKQPTDNSNADIFLQWKGTDACFDFHCPCGNSDHIDADFAYYVECGACGQVYQMPSNLTATPVEWNGDTSHLITARNDGWEEGTVSHQTGGRRQPEPEYILFDFKREDGSD